MKIVLNGSVIDTKRIYDISHIHGMYYDVSDGGEDWWDEDDKVATNDVEKIEWYQFEISFLGTKTKKIIKIPIEDFDYNTIERKKRDLNDAYSEICRIQAELKKYWNHSHHEMPIIKSKYDE